MNYERIVKQLADKLKGADDAQRYRLSISWLQDNPYGWGAENLFAQDCSGSAAFGLLMAGYNVRLTADGYYRLIFTQNVTGFDPGEIAAVFYVADSDRSHGDRRARKGEVVHVTPLVGEDVVLDAAWGKPARLRSLQRAERLHEGFGTTPVIRAADITKLDSLHISGRYPVDDLLLIAD